MRECGLKHELYLFVLMDLNVTPRAGVWIETTGVRLTLTPEPSLPVRECGLKHKFTDKRNSHSGSLPVRECGLKLLLILLTPLRYSHSPCGSVD